MLRETLPEGGGELEKDLLDRIWENARVLVIQNGQQDQQFFPCLGAANRNDIGEG